MSFSLRLIAGGDDLSVKAKNTIIYIFMSLHVSALPGGRNLKIGQRNGTPWGRQHATTLAFFIDSHAWRGILGENGGGGCIVIVRGEEVKATYFPGSKSNK